MPINSGGGGGGLAAISGVTSFSGTASAGTVLDATSASAAAWAFPPGFELNYTQITATVNITATTEGTAVTIISPGAITFDGAPVMCAFGGPAVQTSSTSSSFVVIALAESGTVIQRFCVVQFPNASISIVPVYGAFRFTPTAASHTYAVVAWASSTTGTPQVVAAAGGTGVNSPAWVRFTKV